MMRSILKTALITLALIFTFAGSYSVNRTNANNGGGVSCSELGGCAGGPCLCAHVVLPDGTEIRCGMQC